MNKRETNIEEENFLNKIIASDKDLFFQFSKNLSGVISCDYLSDSVIYFYELTADQIQERPSIILKERVHIKDRENFTKSLNNALLNLTDWEYEFRILLPKKGLIWAKVIANIDRSDSNKICVFGKIINITSIKNFENNHKISEARNQFANMASNVGVWDWDLTTNKVFYSDESLKILEIDESNRELIDNPENWDDQVHPDDREAYFGNIKLHFEQKIPYYETYHRILCNQNYKWILDRGKVILRDEQGNPLRIVGTHTDVSSQKVREENLEETLNLVNNQKNKLLNFAHIVSHNLKTHTGNLKSLLDMKDSGIFETEETLEHIKIVSKDLSEILENLTDLVDFQANENKITENLNLNHYIEKTFSIMLDDFNKKGIKVTNSVSDEFSINFIPAYLDSILLNLTTNAVKYSNPKTNPKLEFFEEKNNNYKVLCVKDNGLGIDLNKHKDHIFGMYKTFHKHENATGIGLFITKNQIESLAGKIEVESQVGVGTTFRVFFKK